jgi:hypothetical protein
MNMAQEWMEGIFHLAKSEASYAGISNSNSNGGKRPGQITFSFAFAFLVFDHLLFATGHASRLLSGNGKKCRLSKDTQRPNWR